MSLNLKDARANCKALVATIPSIGSLESVFVAEVSAGHQPERDEWNQMKPYAVLHFGRPVPDFGRTLADGEKDYPHTWPVAVFLYGSGEQVQDLGDELDERFLDWSPTSDGDSGPFRGGASYSYPLPSTANYPARTELQRYYTCLVNLSRATS